jgi:broad specificity phosphatase PhoE
MACAQYVFFRMRSRIHLVRHGVSAHVHDGSWVNAAGARRFIARYDEAGIRDEPAPSAVIDAAAAADVLAASTLTRAIDSVRRLAPGRQPELTPLLRELDFISPELLPVKLPVPAWDALDFALRGYDILRRANTPELQRARDATDWLLSRVGDGRTILAVTHGGFRRFLHAALVERRCRPEFTRRAYHNWSMWTFTLPS